MNERRVRTMRALAAGLLVLAAAPASAFSVYDGLIFDLGLLNPSTAATNPDPENIVDYTTWSSGSLSTASYVSTFKGGKYPALGTPACIGHGTASVIHQYHSWEDKTTMPVLTFPVNTNWNASAGRTYIYPPVVTFPKPIYNGSNITVYVRFKIDSNVPAEASAYTHVRYLWDNMQTVVDPSTGKNRTIGWRIAYQATVGRYSDVFYLRNFIGGGDNDYLDYGFPFWAGKWYALVCTFETLADGTCRMTEVVTRTDCNSPRGYTYDSTSVTKATRTFGTNVRIDVPAGTSGNSYLGGRKEMANYTDWQPLDSTSGAGIHGSIAEARVYDRILSHGEIISLIAHADACTFATGSANDSADEFAAEDATVPEVFEPKTMNVRQLRKALTASNPSFTVRVPIPREEDGLLKVFRMKTILEGVGETVPYEVWVNGEKAGTSNFAWRNGGDFFLGPRWMRRDDDGNVTIRICRTGDLSGKVCLDALAMSGAWAAGCPDGSFTDTAFRGYLYFFVATSSEIPNQWTPIGGTPGKQYLQDELLGYTWSGSTYYPETSVCFELPECIAKNRPCKFTFIPQGIWYPGTSTKASLNVNGHEFGFIDAMYSNKSYAFTVPNEYLVTGMNRLRIVNESPSREKGGDYNAFRMKYYRFDVESPTQGFVMVVGPEDE